MSGLKLILNIIKPSATRILPSLFVEYNKRIFFFCFALINSILNMFFSYFQHQQPVPTQTSKAQVRVGKRRQIGEGERTKQGAVVF